MKRSAYRVFRVLADHRPHCVAELMHSLSYSEATIRWAFYLLRALGAPLEKVAEGGYKLGDWRPSWEALDDHSKLDELERVVAPGAKTNLLECVSRLQRENLALRERLLWASHSESPCQNPPKSPNSPPLPPSVSTS